MSEPGSSPDERGVNQNGDPGGKLSVSGSTHTPAESPETRLLSAFKTDGHARKVYLAGREYYSEEGKTFVLRLVGKIKQQLSSDPTLRPEYPPSLGLTEFTRRATEAALGRSSHAVMENRVFGVQTPGFTAAVRLGAELLKHCFDDSATWCGPVYLSSPCDDSLAGIFQAAGIQDIRKYYYWDDRRRGVCLEKLLQDLERAPEQSVVVLSASGHYPTGADLSQHQWSVITQLITRRRLFPFLLLPAQALCYGDLERDGWPVQYCASQGMELLCAQSFSHCFGLYGEAVGHLLCVSKQSSLRLSVQSQADKTVRSLWAEPSAQGAACCRHSALQPGPSGRMGGRREAHCGEMHADQIHPERKAEAFGDSRVLGPPDAAAWTLLLYGLEWSTGRISVNMETHLSAPRRLSKHQCNQRS
ncbi:Aspartate aminotransferase, cytoplasmic [Larimichthys crocea]|uniref:Uncharacterized protein n=1 Tax=Larimichthys crocea TaxID=215358 RepID=A0ACD3Q983_LARCR|nr:Aspartate aminotransferase, cytoplasmic [Larimichthys crocea]